MFGIEPKSGSESYSVRIVMTVMKSYNHIAFHVLIHRDIDSDCGYDLIILESLLRT